MSTSIVITILEPGQSPREVRFDGPTVGTIGRGSDCLLRLPCDDAHLHVSRHHCLLDVSPDAISVRDLGSLNGTFINGMCIGGRCLRKDAPPCELASAPCAMKASLNDHPLRDGDELRLGDTILRVSIMEQDDGAEVREPEAELSPA